MTLCITILPQHSSNVQPWRGFAAPQAPPRARYAYVHMACKSAARCTRYAPGHAKQACVATPRHSPEGSSTLCTLCCAALRLNTLWDALLCHVCPRLLVCVLTMQPGAWCSFRTTLLVGWSPPSGTAANAVARRGQPPSPRHRRVAWQPASCIVPATCPARRATKG